MKDLFQFRDEFHQPPFSALGEEGEFDSDAGPKMPLTDETLDAHRQLPHAEGHLHRFAFAEAGIVAQPHQAALQAQIHDRSRPAQP